jgi:hypothetical protein
MRPGGRGWLACCVPVTSPRLGRLLGRRVYGCALAKAPGCGLRSVAWLIFLTWGRSGRHLRSS